MSSADLIFIGMDAKVKWTSHANCDSSELWKSKETQPTYSNLKNTYVPAISRFRRPICFHPLNEVRVKGL